MTCAADQCRHTGSYEDVQTHEDDTHPWFCPSHRCGHDNCKSGIDDLISKRCREHQECAAPQCTSKPDHDAYSNYCPTHTCQGGAGTCALQAISDNRCRDHLKCGLASCLRPCHRAATGRLEFLCHDHLATKCARPGCGRTKLHAHRRYCLDHGCRVADCVCERHPGGGTLCAEHKCTFDTCFQPTAAPTESSSGRVQYLPLFCATHACRRPACLYSRQDGSSYCRDHQCRVPTCANSAACGPGSFCSVHAVGEQGKAASDLFSRDGTSSAGFEECRAAGCLVYVPLGGYCKGHSCVEEGCRRGRLSVVLAGTGEAEEGLVRCFGHERELWRKDAQKGREGVKGSGREVGSQKRLRVMVEDVEDEGDC
jgi:hypothetical protein